MTDIFLKMLNMSLKASYVIIAVIIIRFLLKKAPKKYSYMLWMAAAFRLVCPVSFKSALSLFSLRVSKGGTTHVDLTQVQSPVIDVVKPQANVGLPAVNTAINNSLPVTEPVYSADPLQVITVVASALWIVGIVLLLAYGVLSYVRLAEKLRFAVKFEDNIWQAENVASPFIMGFVKPKIFIPFGLDAHELDYVLAHEKEHIRRFDHIIKPLAFIILIVHWFNPLVWLAFYLMSRDMEMSCDEQVLSKDECSNKEYSTTLLSLAAGKRFPSPTPLAFGESGVKSRIKNALKFKKPALWISIIAVIICIAVIFVCVSDPKGKDAKADDVFQRAYATPEVVYDCGLYSFVPKTDDTPSLFIDENGKIYSKGWYVEYGWVQLGNLWEMDLTKENFDDYFVSDEIWTEGYSVQKLREENLNAWKYESNGNLHYILQQKDGEVFNVAIMDHSGSYTETVLGKEDDGVLCVRWIYRLEPSEGKSAKYSLFGDTYVSYECLYMTPVSSLFTAGDTGYKYYFVEEGDAVGDNDVVAKDQGFVMVNRTTGDMLSLRFSGWTEFPYTVKEWNELFMGTPVDISGYSEKQWLKFYENFALAMMDNELWFVEFRNDEIWSVHSLVKDTAMGPAVNWTYEKGKTAEIEFNVSGNMSAVCTQSDISTDGVNFDAGAEWTDGKIYWSPIDDNGETVKRAQINFSSDIGVFGTIYINSSYMGKDLVYTFEVAGTGLNIKGDGETISVNVVDYIPMPGEEDVPDREPLDFTIDNTGADFFRYEDIADRSFSQNAATDNQALYGEFSFRTPEAASQYAPVVVIGEITDVYYADGDTAKALKDACTVYDMKLTQVLRGSYVPGDMISVSQIGGYHRVYQHEPEMLNYDSPKTSGLGEITQVYSQDSVPEMKIGDKYVMFLHGSEASYVDGTERSIGGVSGCYRVDDDGKISRYVSANKVNTFGTLDELIETVKNTPFSEEKYNYRYLGVLGVEETVPEGKDYTIDNTGTDFFRYEDIADRTMTINKDLTNANTYDYSFRSPAQVSECAKNVVIGEIVDAYYADGNSVNALEGGCIVYDVKLSQVLSGKYAAGDTISVACYGGYYRWYVHQPQILEWAAAGSVKYAGMGDVGIIIGYGGIPEMQIGETYAMFLHDTSFRSFVDGAHRVVGLWTGLYKIDENGMASRYIDADRIWEYGTLEELIADVQENPYNEDKFRDIYIDVSYSD